MIVICLGIGLGYWGGKSIVHGVSKAGRATGHVIHKVLHPKKHARTQEQK